MGERRTCRFEALLTNEEAKLKPAGDASIIRKQEGNVHFPGSRAAPSCRGGRMPLIWSSLDACDAARLQWLLQREQQKSLGLAESLASAQADLAYAWEVMGKVSASLDCEPPDRDWARKLLGAGKCA